ncbi:hypothetical protein MMC11_007779 [Xylographa trunciseda]|nr:hypothetical protein [Xylographa trunciseda]
MGHLDRDLPIDCIEEARLNYSDRLPPFIQHNTKCSVNSRQTVIIPTASGNLPQPSSRKQAELVCRAWSPASEHMFWTYDHNHTRYIVKGFLFDKIKGEPCPHLIFYIWSGKEGMRLDQKKEGFGMRVIALCFVEDAKANFSFDVDEESLIQPHRRISGIQNGRQTRNSLATSEYAATDIGSNDGRTPSYMSSRTLKRHSLVPSATSPTSSDDEPLIYRPRRLHRRTAPISQRSLGSVFLALNPLLKRGNDIAIDTPSSDGPYQSRRISNLSLFTETFPDTVTASLPTQSLVSVDPAPTPSIPSHILSQTVLHISSSASSRGAVPIYLSSCPTMDLFYAKILASWRIREDQVEDVTVTFGWLKDSTPMVVRKEIEDSFELLLEMIQDAPCWTAEGDGRKRCEVMVMVHLKENTGLPETPVRQVCEGSTTQVAVKREILELD